MLSKILKCGLLISNLIYASTVFSSQEDFEENISGFFSKLNIFKQHTPDISDLADKAFFLPAETIPINLAYLSNQSVGYAYASYLCNLVSGPLTMLEITRRVLFTPYVEGKYSICLKIVRAVLLMDSLRPSYMYWQSFINDTQTDNESFRLQNLYFTSAAAGCYIGAQLASHFFKKKNSQ